MGSLTCGGQIHVPQPLSSTLTQVMGSLTCGRIHVPQSLSSTLTQVMSFVLALNVSQPMVHAFSRNIRTASHLPIAFKHLAVSVRSFVPPKSGFTFVFFAAVSARERLVFRMFEHV